MLYFAGRALKPLALTKGLLGAPLETQHGVLRDTSRVITLLSIDRSCMLISILSRNAMKKNFFLQTMVIVMLLGVLLALPVQVSAVCLIGYEGIGEEAETPPENPLAPRSLSEVESEISKADRYIKDYSNEAIEAHQEVVQIKSWAGPPRENLINEQLQKAADAEREMEGWREYKKRCEQERQTLISHTGGCFLPDTLVTMADGSFKSFEQIRPGDHVLTCDIGYQTMVSKPVIDVYTVEGNHLYTINGELATTGSERLLSNTGWKRVRDLHKGDEVQIDGRMVEIISIDYRLTDHKLYNMQVDDSHNFYVVTGSGARYLVHNSGGGGGAK